MTGRRWKGMAAAGLAGLGAAGCLRAEPPPPGFVRLSEVAPDIAQDVRYARDFNFTGAPVPGYEAAECILTEFTARALIRVEARLAAQGYGLVVWDCYRPVRAVQTFVAWAADAASETVTGAGGLTPGAVFFPGIERSELIPQGYIAARSSHSIGHTVDVGLRRAGAPVVRPDWADATPCTAPFAERFAETGLDLGTAFDCFSPLSAVDAPVSAEARANRRRLAAAMEAEGFRGYSAEWWHFRNHDDPATAPRDFPVR